MPDPTPAPIKNHNQSAQLSIGLALGGGSARGWAHIGIIQALCKLGIEPNIICGTSIGALVGGAYAANQLDTLQQWVSQLRLRDIVSLYDIRLNGGVIKGQKLFSVLSELITDSPIEQLPKSFAAVATRLDNGQEIWLRENSLLEAIRASCALPGLFMPVFRHGYWLVDGALVNPVPVSTCRALGADIVIAADVNGDLLGQRMRKSATATTPQKADNTPPDTTNTGRSFLFGLTQPATPTQPAPPSMLEVIAESINIMQERITRSRMAGDPPDIVLSPRLSHIGFMEFHRANDAIAAGELAVKRMQPLLEDLYSPLA